MSSRFSIMSAVRLTAMLSAALMLGGAGECGGSACDCYEYATPQEAFDVHIASGFTPAEAIKIIMSSNVRIGTQVADGFAHDKPYVSADDSACIDYLNRFLDLSRPPWSTMTASEAQAEIAKGCEQRTYQEGCKDGECL